MNHNPFNSAGAAIVGAALFAGAAGPAPAGIAMAAPAVPAADDGARCAALIGSKVGGATIDSATYVADGTKLPPLGLQTRGAMCQVRASISPVAKSIIKIEIWLPTAWNNKMLGLGGAGTSGGMSGAAVAFLKPVGQGYVTIATDAGHDNTDLPTWALDRERIVDYGYRANHLGAQVAKALIARYYGATARRAYFQGCSNGADARPAISEGL